MSNVCSARVSVIGLFLQPINKSSTLSPNSSIYLVQVCSLIPFTKSNFAASFLCFVWPWTPPET
ncbi:hypothetical protein AXX17_AT1G40590 [Arabidopsis thaliana]|uniref:Uncharacterized protein n=1 Tax=Arabidopsis thaliana TaxID=3702 RepID=A0A178WGW8_ARATH|nr:hypothetical protein AXX17_AT1G40590 [Arabidopsis thaliana]